MRHILSVDQFDRQQLEEIFASADTMRQLVAEKGGDARFSTRVSANLFCEPSTRTFSSFAAAMYRLGGSVIPITDLKNTSVTKGETLEDTVRILAGYTDCIVIRHFEAGAATRAAAVSSVPIINAGDGAEEHPTQALLDLYTIMREKGRIDGLTITCVGDLKNARTTHSFVKLLNYFDVTLNFVSREEFAFPPKMQAKIKNTPTVTDKLEDTLHATDVFYVTRIQKERITNPAEYEKAGGTYVINNDVLKNVKPDAIVMQPLPRTDEIDPEIDRDSRAAYFRQAENGLYVRMALLDMVINRP